MFVEAELGDPSEFQHSPLMEVVDDDGRFIISVKRCASVAHVIATIALEISHVGKPPEIHFGWSDDNPLAAAIGFFLFGEGNVPWRVRELIRKAEPESGSPAGSDRRLIFGVCAAPNCFASLAPGLECLAGANPCIAAELRWPFC